MSQPFESSILEQNKKVVARLFDVLTGTIEEAWQVIDDVMPDEGYVQHNPLAGDTREALRAFYPMIMRRPSTPEDPVPDWLDAHGTLEVNYIAEGDLVVRQEVRTHGMLIDIFRVRDGKVREHWDAFRPNPGTERIPGL